MKRRRFLALGGLAGAGLVAGCGRKELELWSWEGILFRSPVGFTLHGMEEGAAEILTELCVAEMARLEKMFSLYDEQSDLARLNREGVLRGAPAEFRELTGLALEMAELSGGVFDPTIQPYWKLLYEGGGDEGAREAALALVDFRNVMVTKDRVAFAKEGMAMTLNGMVQGYVTDRVAALVRAAGVKHALINLGEYAAIGGHPEGRPWTLAVRSGGAEGEAVGEVEIADEALAVSSGGAMRFGAGRGNHLVRPDGGATPEKRVVAVVAPNAVVADGLATSCALMREEDGRDLVGKVQGARLQEFGT